MSQWYYAVDGQAAGPVDEAALVQLVQNGTIDRTTAIAEAGAQTWSTVAEQAARLGLDTPPAAPAPSPWESPAPAEPAPSAPAPASWEQPATPAPSGWEQPAASTPAPSTWEQPAASTPAPSSWEQPGAAAPAPSPWDPPSTQTPAAQPWQATPSTPAPNAWDQPAGGVAGAGWGQPAAEWGTPGATTGFGAAGFGVAGGALVPADLGKRFIALIIDSAIAFGLYIAVFIVAAILGAVSETLGGLVMLLGILGVLGFNIWNLFIRQGKTGQSIGKAKQGIKLVRMSDGQPIGAGMSFVRYILGSLLANLCLVDYWWVFTNQQRQRLCDVILKTQVVAA